MKFSLRTCGCLILANVWIVATVAMIMKRGASASAPAPLADAWRADPTGPDIDRDIHNEQIRLIYHQGTTRVASATVCAAIITLFLWFNVPSYSLVFWLLAVAVSACARIAFIYGYLRADKHARSHRFWGTALWLGSLIAGLIWGSWPLMFYWLYSAEHLMLVSAIFAGMVAVSAASGSIYLPSFMAFSIPLVLPLSVLHLMSGVDSLQIAGLLLLFFLAFNFILVIRSSHQNRELNYAKFKNQQLTANLEAEKLVAQRAIVAKSHFLAAASHDLRQPLHAMGLFIGALRSREKDPQKMRIIEDMGKSADALNNLFNSLLDVSRLDADIIDVNPVHISAGKIFDALRAQFEQQIKEKNIHFRLCAEHHVLYCDPVLLERVLRNLLSNAVQYTQSGTITLNCDEHPESLKQITIEDTGIGIPAHSLEDVFSEYCQLNNPSRDKQKGLGLGLSIVKRLCQLMELPLDVHSSEGQGTVFRVLVPAGDAQKADNPIIALHSEKVRGRNVLVIDDERLVLHGMRQLLEDWGCEVLIAESAGEALKLLALSNSLPDIMICDYRLAEHQNGVDAVAAIRECIEFELPAIIMTGDTSPAGLKQVKDAGLQLLHKPVNADELYRVIQQQIEEHTYSNSSTETAKKVSNG